MIYLASPYSDPDQTVRQERYDKTRNVLEFLIKAGLKVYSPIVMCHYLKIGTGSHDDYREHNEHMIDKSDMVLVLTLPGYIDSVGVKAEIEYAQAQGERRR